MSRPAPEVHAQSRPAPEVHAQSRPGATGQPRRWSERFRAIFDTDEPQGLVRRGRGVAFARAGRAHDLRVLPGRLTGRVQGKLATPHTVALTVPTLDDAAWEALITSVTGQARHSVRLLSGQTPDGLAEELDAVGVHLFPQGEEVAVESSEADAHPTPASAWAVIEAAAEALEHDPFMLLRLRGRGREQLLAELAERRRGSSGPAGVPVPDGMAGTAPRAPLPTFRPLEVPQESPLAVRGDPPGWTGGVSAADLLGPLTERAAAWAEQVREAATGGV